MARLPSQRQKSQKIESSFYLIRELKGLGKLTGADPFSKTSVGELFESMVILNIYRLNKYFQTNYRLSYYATKIMWKLRSFI